MLHPTITIPGYAVVMQWTSQVTVFIAGDDTCHVIGKVDKLLWLQQNHFWVAAYQPAYFFDMPANVLYGSRMV